MSNLENHMDDLFRKAADEYPLKVSNGNWNELLPHLQAGSSAAAIDAKRPPYKKYLLLLAFFILAGITSDLILNYSSVQNKSVLAEIKEQHTGIKPQASKRPAPAIAATINQNNSTPFINQPKSNTRLNFTTPVKNKQSESHTKNSILIENVPNEPTLDQEKGNLSNTDKRNIYPEVNENIKTENQATKTISAEKTTLPETGSPSIALDLKTKSHKAYIYYGISAGMELNTVKNQGMTKAGFNAGAIIGLQISNRLSVETGIQFSKKKYHSDGKYFQPKDGSMPATMTINSLDGNSNLIEMPLNIKYNINKRINSFYVGAGVSSYILTKETNQYDADMNGQPQKIISTYQTNHFYPASMLNFKVGYQQKLGKQNMVRVEPYIQIPLSGMGLGSMPLTSAGLHLVLTRNKQ